MKYARQIFFLSIFLFNISNDLQAQPFQVLSTPGGIPANSMNVGTGYNLQVYLHENLSYECSLLPAIFFDSPTFRDRFRVLALLRDKNGSFVSITPNGNVFPQVSKVVASLGTTNISDGQHSLMRFSVIAPSTGLYKSVATDVNGNGVNSSAMFKCRETTLYGSYNRFFAQTAIVEIQNKAETAFPLKITIIDAQGNVVVNAQESTANANTRTDIIFANLPANNYGQIIVNHTAPFGALSGIVAEYDQGANGQIVLKRERPLQIAQKN